MRVVFISLMAAVSVMLGGCLGGPAPETRAGAQPALSLPAFLEGRTYAYGAFERGGVLDRKFRVEIDGTWDGRVLTLDEYFLYDDGQTQRRIWEMEQVAPIRFIGTAKDVPGEAQIEIIGDSAFFGYLVDLVLSDGSTVRVRFNDRIYAMGEEVWINRARVSKFGLTVGDVTLVFLKDRPSDWTDVPRG